MKKFDGNKFKTGYLDESGDSGGPGSKYLVLTYICSDEGKKLSKILKKTKEQLKRIKKGARWLNRLGGDIKFIAIKKDGKYISESEKEKILFDLLYESFINHKELPSKIIADKDYFKNKKISSLVVKNY